MLWSRNGRLRNEPITPTLVRRCRLSAMKSSSQNTHAPPQDAGCLACSVTEAVAQEPALEAVTVNRSQKTISVATLGRADVPRITERITTTIQKAGADQTSPC